MKRALISGLSGLILALCLAGCSDDGGKPLDDGGPPPRTEGGTLWPDQGVPTGCEQKCLDEAPYKCVTSSDSCVDCIEDKHCQGNPYAFGPTCDTSSNKCTCQANADCVGNKNGAKCDDTLGRCYCDSDSDCEAPRKCVGKYLSTKVCALPCKVDVDCKDPIKPRCDAAAGECVECVTTEHCKDSPEGTLCEEKECTCKAAVDCNGDYPWGNKCRTSTGDTSRCGCDVDGDCGGNANGPKCAATYNKCTCETDGDCTKAPYTKCAKPYSYASYMHCQKPCATDADCASKGTLKACDNGTCVACLDDSHCTSSYSAHCDAAKKECVECKNDSHCSGSKPFCDVANAECVECKANPDCGASQDGSLCDNGSCGCKVDAECKGASAWGNKCVNSYGRCGCDADGNCGGNANGPKCYTSLSKCTCETDGQCTKAPYTKCAKPSSYSSYMHCQKACAADADCADKSGLNICKVATGKCVQCKGDADCKSSYSKYCMVATNTCVECKADADCTSKSYPACQVAKGKCVACLNSAHCAQSEDGKVCDTAKSQCTCKVNADCANAQFNKVCDATSGCQECKTDPDCGPGSLGNTCSGSICVCGADADCASNTTGHMCDVSMQACSCMTDADCPAPKKCTGDYIGIAICQ